MNLCTSIRILAALALICVCACDDGDPISKGNDAGARTDGSTRDGGQNGGPDAGMNAAWFACEGPEDCVLTPNDCCGTCGFPTADSHIAIRLDQRPAYRDSLDCDLVDCPGCPGIALQAPNGNVRAICGDSGQCEVYTVSESEEAACNEDDDCMKRWGPCCSPCVGEDNWDYVAINRNAEPGYTDNVCPDESFGCPECASPDFPGEFKAICEEDTRCILVPDELE